MVLVFLAQVAAAGESSLRRLTLRNDILGLEAVGRVEIGAGSFCTGVLIETDLVLTAAHCLFQATTGARLDLGLFQFRTGLKDGVPVAERQVRRAVVHPLYDRLDTDRRRAIRHDVALLQLDRPIAEMEAPPFVTDFMTADTKNVSVVSYEMGQQRGSSQQRQCSVVARSEGLFVFSCDMDYSASGAPIFAKIAGRKRVVSMVSSGNRSAEGSLVFGMQLPGLIDDLKSALRSGRGVTFGAETVVSARRLTVGSFAPAGGTGAKFLRP